MHRETVLTPADLIWPLFVTDGSGVEEPVTSLPGVSRWSVDHIAKRAKEAVDLGIPCIALFPNTQPDRRSDDGAEALNPDNLMCRAIKAVRDACGSDIGILTAPDGRSIAVAIYVTGQGSRLNREKRIASIARAIYDGYTQPGGGWLNARTQ